MIFSVKQFGPSQRWEPAGIVKPSLESIKKKKKKNTKYAHFLQACQATPAFLNKIAEQEISKMVCLHLYLQFMSFVLVERWKLTQIGLIHVVDIKSLQ